MDLDEQVASSAVLQPRHALACKPELLPVRGAGGHLQQYPSLQGGDGYLAAQHQGGIWHIEIFHQVVVLAAEARVRLERDHQVEVAARARARAGVTLAGYANARAVAHP